MSINFQKFSLSRLLNDPEKSKRDIRAIGMNFEDSYKEISKEIIRTLNSKITGIESEIEVIKTKINEVNSSETASYDDISDLHGELGQADWHLEVLETQKMLSAEMHIINLYRSVEISIKKIISIAYSEENAKEFFKWDYMASFLKARNIEINKFPSYSAIDELRIINNDLKHQGTVSTKSKAIAEFKVDAVYNFNNLSRFIERIKNIPQEFLKNLGNAVITERYEYPDNKLEEIAEKFRKIMDQNTIERFSQILSENE